MSSFSMVSLALGKLETHCESLYGLNGFSVVDSVLSWIRIPNFVAPAVTFAVSWICIQISCSACLNGLQQIQLFVPHRNNITIFAPESVNIMPHQTLLVHHIFFWTDPQLQHWAENLLTFGLARSWFGPTNPWSRVIYRISKRPPTCFLLSAYRRQAEQLRQKHKRPHGNKSITEGESEIVWTVASTLFRHLQTCLLYAHALYNTWLKMIENATAYHIFAGFFLLHFATLPG